MRTSTITLAALAVATIALSAPAEARTHRSAQFGPTFDAAAAPAYPMGRQARTRHARSRAASRRVASTTSVYRADDEDSRYERPSHAVPHRRELGPVGHGLVTVTTAAGIAITCSAAFASEAASLIADAVAHGIKFHRITCYSRARTHVANSNHHSGNAFDSHPSIPAQLVRAHGLRSGCDFRDCPHVDNARNVGGVAYWNGVKHRGSTVSASAARRHYHHRHHRALYAWRQTSIEPTATTFSAKRRSRHSDGCSRRGDAAGINCQLRAWVHCSGGSVRATSFNASGRRACPGVRGNIVADKRLPCGTPLTITNARTGRSVNAVVGDRGPGTIAVVDLSYQTAAAVGVNGSGCVYVGGGFREAAVP